MDSDLTSRAVDLNVGEAAVGVEEGIDGTEFWEGHVESL